MSPSVRSKQPENNYFHKFPQEEQAIESMINYDHYFAGFFIVPDLIPVGNEETRKVTTEGVARRLAGTIAGEPCRLEIFSRGVIEFLPFIPFDRGARREKRRAAMEVMRGSCK